MPYDVVALERPPTPPHPCPSELYAHPTKTRRWEISRRWGGSGLQRHGVQHEYKIAVIRLHNIIFRGSAVATHVDVRRAIQRNSCIYVIKRILISQTMKSTLRETGLPSRRPPSRRFLNVRQYSINDFALTLAQLDCVVTDDLLLQLGVHGPFQLYNL